MVALSSGFRVVVLLGMVVAHGSSLPGRPVSEKTDARSLQLYTGASYTTCLRWVRTLLAENLVPKTDDRAKALRVALHHRFPDVRIQRDEEEE